MDAAVRMFPEPTSSELFAQRLRRPILRGQCARGDQLPSDRDIKSCAKYLAVALSAAGTNNDVGVASAYATARMLRLADGPDEVHRNQIAKLELAKYD